MFDIKLKDGRYFKNVDVLGSLFEGFIENIESILDNGDYKMKIYHCNDVDCENMLAEFVSDNVEYICKAYTYKEDEK